MTPTAWTALLPLAVLLATVLSGVAGAAPAAAHTVPVGTEPAAGAVVAGPPARVAVDFSEPPLDGSARLAVAGPGGTVPATPALDGTTLSAVLLAALGPGGYTVTWRVAAGDGHVVSGTWSFAVAAGAPSPTASPIPPSPARPSRSAPAAGPSPTSAAATQAAPPATSAGSPGGRSAAPFPGTLPWGVVLLLLAAIALVGRARSRRAGHRDRPDIPDHADIPGNGPVSGSGRP